MTPIIDPHQHLWDLDVFRLPWTESADPILQRSYSMADYIKAAEGTDIVRTVYMEVDVAPDQIEQESEYVLDVCGRPDNPIAGAVLRGRPGEPGFRDYVSRFKETPHFKGVRQVLHVPELPPGHCLERAFVEDVGWLGEQGLSFDLCLRNNELADGAKLADECPGTQFILDHCGNPDVQADRSAWEASLETSAGPTNMACKVSGLFASAKPGEWTVDDFAPFIRHTIACFGVDRVLFAGNWPVCNLGGSLRQWVDVVRTVVADRSEPDKRRLFFENAERIYRLDPIGRRS